MYNFIDHYTTCLLLVLLLFLVIVSSFFAAIETSMMSLNKYKLRALAKTNKQARRVMTLLERPDRLLGMLLLGNNFVNIAMSVIATLIGVDLLGETLGAPITTLIMTAIILIFAEIMPKTLAILKADKIAYSTSLVVQILLKTLFPVVFVLNAISNMLLRLFGVKALVDEQSLSAEELKALFYDAGIPRLHRNMIAGVLDLEKTSVADIMIPRSEITGLNLDDEQEVILKQLKNNQHKILPVFRENLDNVIGFLFTRELTTIIDDDFSVKSLRPLIKPPYFVPFCTTLSRQIINFQKNKSRIALVVDEYGDLKGLITLEDILEEIVGEFTTVNEAQKTLELQADGSVVVDSSISIRVLNMTMDWSLPTDKAKTLNGLIISYLEVIPEEATCVLIEGYPLEILSTDNNMTQLVRVFPRLKPREKFKK